MKWVNRTKDIEITLPDLVSAGVWTEFRLRNESMQLCWEPLLRTLFVRKAAGQTEVPLKYRASVTRRFPGEMFAEVLLEYVGGPQTSTQTLQQELAIHVPGLEGRSAAAGAKGEQVRSPMVGKVLRILASPGQTIERGQELLVIEAMKMENKIYARNAGVVGEVLVNPGDQVSVNQLLLKISAP